MSYLGTSRVPPFNIIQDKISLPQFPKKCAIRPFSFDSFYIKLKAKLEASIIWLPALGSYISAGNSFQTNMELNVAVHRGCGVNSYHTKEKELTPLSSLPVVDCPLVNLNSHPSLENLELDSADPCPLSIKYFTFCWTLDKPPTHLEFS